MVAKTRGVPSSRKLKFREKLVAKPPLTTDVLLKRIKALHTELADMDQELVDVSSLDGFRKELITHTILLHKDKGVKAFAACCIADLLRLYAPDAPFTQNELTDIFQFFIQQLSGNLKSTDTPYYNQYFHLLESLSTVKSVVLVCDLPKSDDLVEKFFKDFFKLVRFDLSKKIELFMADILVAIVDECQSIPSGVLTTLLAQFMDSQLRMDQPAYRLAIQVCNATATKLQRNVCQYFTDIILQHSEDEEFDEIRKAHDLIKRLNRSCPSLLHNVVPQLEEELRVEEIQIRLMATQVLGEMFADKGGMEFMKKYPSTWTFWIARKNDKAPAVRLAFVEASKGLLSATGEMRDLIEESLQLKLLDPDEKVRTAVCKVYSNIDYETALHHVSKSQWTAICGRGLDKKSSVRKEALNCIGKVFSLGYSEIENNDPAAIKQFAWIPDRLLSIHASASEAKLLVEQVLADYIFPLPSPNAKGGDADEAAWTERLLLIMRSLQPKSVIAMLNLSSLKALASTSIYERFVDTCKLNNAGVIDENEEAVSAALGAIIKKLAVTYPDPVKASEDLHTFAKLNEGRLYTLLKTCLSTQTDLKSLIKATSEFLRRIEQASSGIKSTMTAFLRRASLRLINQSSIATLIKTVQKGDPDGDGHGTSQAQLSANNAETLLTYISRNCPSLYKAHVTELVKAIADEKNSRLVEVSLQALSSLTELDNSLTPTDKRFGERITRFVVDSGHRRAKFAARLLCCFKDQAGLCTDAVESISSSLPDSDPELQLAHVAALSVFARSAPEAFEQKSETVMKFLVKDILMAPDSRPDVMDTGYEWVEDAELWSELKTKLLSLKVCRNRCLAHASSEQALEVATPVLKMFISILENEGTVSPGAENDPKEKSRLRLQAAISLLQLSMKPVYANAIAPHFILLAITIQDSCYQVRIKFLQKLVTLLSTRELPPRYNVIPFLSVHDPEAEVKTTARLYVTNAHRNLPPQMKVEWFELISIRLLHLLAHHPDFAVASENLSDMAKYIQFYVDCIATEDNVSLLFHLVAKAKTVRDAESDEYSENLYYLSEIAQKIIQNRAKLRQWSLVTFPPGKVKLPSDILKPLPNAETASKILKRVYLPNDIVAQLEEQGKQNKTITAEAKEKVRAERKTAPRKRKATSTTNGNAKRSRTTARRKKDEESEEEESEPSSEGDEDGEQNEPPSTAGEPSDPAEEMDEDEPEPEKGSRPGRGAMTKAKARIKQQARKSKR